MSENNEKPRIVAHTETCSVCKKPIYIIVDHEYNTEPGFTAVKAENAYLCDFADDDGCFNHYHDECFEKHTCGVYPRKAT